MKRYLALLLLCSPAFAQNYTIVARAWFYNPAVQFTVVPSSSSADATPIGLAGGQQLLEFWIGPFPDYATCNAYRRTLSEAIGQGYNPFADTLNLVNVPVYFQGISGCQTGLQ